MDQFLNLPTPVKALLAILTAGCVIGAAYMIDPRAVGIVLIGLLVVAVLFGLYLLALHVVQRRRADGMGGQIEQHSTVAPRGISDPARRAKLDDLRQNFQKGLQRFRAAGKDIYSLPWYMVVGEPGSGKTEMVRHCNVGFPPGLQDELQGAGGTINMHWWFTNHAVILDTAGRLMFEEVPPGATSEWREFLGLLRKSRTNCPVNGLLLVIPADSLIKDSSDVIANKAGRIAQQLNTIQSALDVRFPVFIVITKCDLINGFREFFNDLSDPQLQHQMLGWSNPTPLDEPFRPELAENHLKGVADRVRRRRMGLMQDPSPQTDANGRRLDEVDALFSLPVSINLLAPRLKRYLETIFVPNEWSAKPLFLRGIYFSSSMREGSALDLELAEAMGVPVDSLPEGKTWEKERAYFLRDLFLEKIFKERGLVTRASNTKTMLRRRQAILFGCGFVGLVLLFLASWMGARSLRDSVGREREFWLAASDGWQENVWRPIVSPEFKGSTTFVFNGDQIIRVGSEEIPLREYHRRLAELARSDINVPWVFRPWNSLGGANPSRRRAQRIIFETGVVRPLVNAARDKIATPGATWTAASSETLALLVRLENFIYQRAQGLTPEEVTAAGFLTPLGRLLYAAPTMDPDLAVAFDWVYLQGGDGRNTWPPAWLSAGYNLSDNRPIASGLGAFVNHTIEAQKAQTAGFELIKKVRGEIRLLRQTENELARLAAQPALPPETFGAQAEKLLAALLAQKTAVDRAAEEARQSGLFEAGKLLLFSSYKNLVEETRKQAETAFQLLQVEIDRFPALAATDDKEGNFTLPAEISRRLQDVRQQFKARTEGAFNADEVAELQEIDGRFMEGLADPAYVIRAETYQTISSLWHDPIPATETVIGRFEQQIGNIQRAAGGVRDKAGRYTGTYGAEFSQIVRRLVERAEVARTQTLFNRAFAEVEARLQRSAGFPFLRGGRPMTVTQLRDVRDLFQRARNDLPAMRTASSPAIAGKLEEYDRIVQRVGGIADALVTADGQPMPVTITILNYAEQRRQLMRQLGTEEFGSKFIGNIWRVVRFGAQRIRVETRQDTDLGRLPVSETVLRLEFFKNVDDADPHRNFVLDAPWAPVRLLQEPFARRLSGGKDWEIMLSLRDDNGQDRYLLLLFRFEQSLPEIEQWPSADRPVFNLTPRN